MVKEIRCIVCGGEKPLSRLRYCNNCAVQIKLRQSRDKKREYRLMVKDYERGVEDLIENHHKSLKECAAILDVGRTWVYNRHLLAAKLIREVQLDIVMGLISPRAATEIAAVHAREQQRIASAVKQKNLSFREASALVQIIKDEDVSDRMKKLALDDPRTVIKAQR